MFRTDDTIVAISTAAGSAARAIVRLSGPQAGPLAETVFMPSARRLSRAGGFRWLDGRARVGPAELPARAYVFCAPKSYTRQDVVEIHIPGPAAAATALTAELIAAGARQSEAGEFTARAFLSGRLDLSAAEAVADIISAADDFQLRTAMAALSGQVARLCGDFAGQVADVLASVEAAIDLAEENIQLDQPGKLASRLTKLAEKLRNTAAQAADISETADTPRVVIAGRCNVGKSSLLNALTGTDRAIVSALAGTTRDVLSASTILPDGGAVLLQDAAGLTQPAEPLAAAADNAARRAVARADAVCFVADLADHRIRDDLKLLAEVRLANPRAPLLLLANKVDLLDAAVARLRLDKLESALGLAAIATSAKRLDGLDLMRSRLADQLNLTALRGGESLGLHTRQKRCLLSAAEAAQRAARLLAGANDVADVAELAAVDLRAALAEMGQISGEIVTENILGRIFARFCVGK
ncbi:MAG: GTPase [Planctomycetota bacterium]|nr:GTPase [Planctomycetota bacterium]